MTPTWVEIFLDVPRASLAEATAFWSAATATTPSSPRGEDDQFLTLLPADGTPVVKLQAHDGGPRVHLDLATADRPGLQAAAQDLGAELAWLYEDVPVLRSPGGLLFCVTAGSARPRLARGASSILDQVVLDIPARLWEPEVAFWRALTGRELSHGRSDAYTRLVDADPSGPVRFLLQRLDDDQPSVTAHPDLAVADRESETRQHTDLGAAVLATHEAWTILRSPDGHVYCLTDRDPLTGHVR